jgi:hypothetical protein
MAHKMSAVVDMLSPICEHNNIGDYLSKLEAGGGWAYDDATLTMHYITRAGQKKLRCFTVTGITRDEAAAIADDPDVEIVRAPNTFRTIVNRARK